jgi:hypothetical protein
MKYEEFMVRNICDGGLTECEKMRLSLTAKEADLVKDAINFYLLASYKPLSKEERSSLDDILVALFTAALRYVEE